MGKVSKEVAKKEIEQWLESKKVDQRKIEDNADGIESLVNSIADGHLVMNPENFSFKHTLKHPVTDDEGNPHVSELVYKARLKMSEVRNRTRHVKPTDTFGLVSAYICALTGQGSGVVDELDTEDYRVAQNIAAFFL